MHLQRREFLQACAAAGLAGCGAGAAARGGRWHAWGTQGTRNGSFIRPRAIGVRAEEVFVIDVTGRVQVFSTEGALLRMWDLPRHDNGTPTGITFSENGRVIIPDTHNSRILEYTADGELLDQWGSYGSGTDEFIYPTDIACGPDNMLYISEYGQAAERIHVFDSQRNFVRQWGEHGGAPGQFNRAMSLAQSPEGLLLVADTANNRVQCFTSTGEFVRALGDAGGALLKYPHDLALVPDGSVLVAEYGSHCISRFTQEGRFLGAYGKAGRGQGALNAPRGVAVSTIGQVFVADTDNHRVQSFFLEDFA